MITLRSEAQRRAAKKYKAKVKTYTIECYPTDANIIYKLESERAKNGYSNYIKKLIKNDIERNETK